MLDAGRLDINGVMLLSPASELSLVYLRTLHVIH